MFYGRTTSQNIQSLLTGLFSVFLLLPAHWLLAEQLRGLLQARFEASWQVLPHHTCLLSEVSSNYLINISSYFLWIVKYQSYDTFIIYYENALTVFVPFLGCIIPSCFATCPMSSAIIGNVISTPVFSFIHSTHFMWENTWSMDRPISSQFSWSNCSFLF